MAGSGTIATLEVAMSKRRGLGILVLALVPAACTREVTSQQAATTVLVTVATTAPPPPPSTQPVATAITAPPITTIATVATVAPTTPAPTAAPTTIPVVSSDIVGVAV